jgi:hypothetical protein
MRILADENVHMEIVVGLRKEGFDLLTAMEEDSLGERLNPEVREYTART